MPVERRRLRLRGAYSGQTIVLANIPFTNGEVELFDTTQNLDGLCRYLKKSFQAEEVPIGELQNDPDRSERSVPSLVGGVLTSGKTLTQEETDEIEKHARVVRGRKRGSPEGRGPERPTSKIAKIRAALEKLDPDNDDDWTALGKPRMDAVARLMGTGEITRAEIDAVSGGELRPGCGPEPELPELDQEWKAPSGSQEAFLGMGGTETEGPAPAGEGEEK